MATLKVKFATTAAIAKVWADGVRLTFDKDGIAKKDLTDGSKHVLQWVVRGEPAAVYYLEVIAPQSVSKVLAKDERLGDDRIGFGQYRFRL